MTYRVEIRKFAGCVVVDFEVSLEFSTSLVAEWQWEWMVVDDGGFVDYQSSSWMPKLVLQSIFGCVLEEPVLRVSG